MRRFIGIAMPLLFILCAITGIAESSPEHEGPPGAHIFIAILLIMVLVPHAWLNRKALLKCYRRTAKKPAYLKTR